MAASGADRSIADPLITLYYWRQGFVLLAPSFALDRRKTPYRRLSATLMYAMGEPFTLETGEAGTMIASAALIAPKVLRRRIIAVRSSIFICDLAVATPEFNALASMLGGGGVVELDRTAFSPLQPDIERMHRGALPPQDLQALIGNIVFAISGQRPHAPPLHPKIAHALELIDAHSMQVTTLGWLAGQVGLSPSRFRHLFAEQLGCSLTHYLRWAAVWKGSWLWSRGKPIVEVAEEVGFHDLAHANRAFNEIFGLNPSYVFNPQQVRLFRCSWT